MIRAFESSNRRRRRRCYPLVSPPKELSGRHIELTTRQTSAVQALAEAPPRHGLGMKLRIVAASSSRAALDVASRGIALA